MTLLSRPCPSRGAALRAARRRLAQAIAVALLAACSQPPALPQSDMPSGPAPGLLPVDGLLARAQTGTVNDQTGAALAARGSALRARAAAIAADAKAEADPS